MAVASFHLLTYPRLAAAAQLARVPLDRAALRRVPGVRFAKLLGTGAGRRMATSADLRRWAAFAIWDDDDSLDAFVASHPISLRWDDATDERFDVALRPLGAHGSWDGGDPLADPIADAIADPTAGHGPDTGTGTEPDDEPEAGGTVAVLTRATVRWSKVPAFVRAVPAVDAHLGRVDGLLETVGVGEVPIGRQATFSLWRDGDAVRDFAYRSPEHTEVIRRTHDEGWYGEEWFARFHPTRWSGTWSGTTPLGPATWRIRQGPSRPESIDP